MPWKAKNEPEQRYELVRAMRAGGDSISQLSRRWRVSRKTAYKWFRRYEAEGLRGLEDQTRRPRAVTLRTPRTWLERIRRLRKKHPTWGARKLHYLLKQTHGDKVPAVSTQSRWLKRWGVARGRRRSVPGPIVLRASARPARKPNEVWTVDFKGWYRTGDGRRVDPLTVRDLYSRYGLAIALLRRPTIEQTRRQFVRIFGQYGLPERIRCDNGTPFGAAGRRD